MTAEANAAVDGTMAVGAERVLVNDSHCAVHSRGNGIKSSGAWFLNRPAWSADGYRS
jgi:hypothetical protein